MKHYINSIEILLLVFLLACSSNNTDTKLITFEQTAGPTGGNIDVLAINHRGDLFSAGTSGGIYRSANEGETWEMINEGMTYSHVSNLITVGDTIYALTQSDGLYLSVNSGLLWDKINVPFEQIKGIEQMDDHHIVVFSADSIITLNSIEAKILDHGFSQIISVSAADGKIIISDGTELFAFNNKNSSWKRLPVTIPEDLSCLLLSGNNSILIGTQQGALLKGSLYASELDTLFQNPGKKVKTIFPLGNNQNGIVFEGPWFSDIAGGGYVMMEDGQSIEKITNGEADFVNDFILTDKYIIAAGSQGIFKSTDNAFKPINKGLKNQRVNALAFNHQGILFAGTYGGVFATPDEGDSWIEKNKGLTHKGVLDFVTDSEGRLFVGTYLSSIFTSVDHGENWELRRTGLPENTWMISLGVNSKDDIFVATTSKGVYKSSDHGKSWQHAFKGFDKVGLYSIGISPDDIIYAGGVDGRVYISYDEGAAWSASELDSINTTKTEVYSDNTVIEFVFRNDKVFAGTASGGIFVSSDNGKMWKNISYNLPIDNVRSMLIMPDGKLIIGTNGSEDYEHFTGESIFLLDEDNKKWIRADSGLFHTRIKALALSPYSNNIFAGSWGGGVFKSLVPND